MFKCHVDSLSSASMMRALNYFFAIVFIAVGSVFPLRAQNRFVQVPSYPAGGSLPTLLAQEDMTRDGHLDLIVMNVNATTKIETVSLLPGTGTGGYRAPETISSYPVSYGTPLAADVNRDRRVDLIFYVASTQSIQVYLGLNEGFLSAPVISKAGACTNRSYACQPPSIQVADVNGDGNPDLLMAFTDQSYSSVLYLSLGNGNGSFRAPVLLNTYGLSILSHTTGDFNGDGLPDVAFAGFDGLQILLGNGDGSFRKGASQFLGAVAGQLLSADLRGNGKSDLILINALSVAEAEGSTCRGGGVSVMLNNGDGTFPVNPQGYAAGQNSYGAILADMNGDGRPDLVVANQLGASYTVLLNAGSGKFLPPVSYRAPEPTAGNFLIGDLNGDGRPDLTISSRAGVEVFRNTGAGRLLAPVSLDLPAAAEPLATYASDLNHDNIPDLAMFVQFDTTSPCWVPYQWGMGQVSLSQNGQPFSSQASFKFPGSYPSSFGLGDFNGDGNTDIVADASPRGVPPEIQVQFNNGKGQFPTAGPAIDPSDNYVYYNVAVGDFNRDGRADIALGGQDLKIGLGDGKGNFTFKTYSEGSDFSTAPVLVRDINSDGKLDLINLDFAGNAVDLLLGNGNGTFQALRKFSTVKAPAFVAIGDFNRDGKLDLIVAGGSEISLLLNNGNGTFAPAINYPAGGPVSAISVIGLTGNGNQDVIAADGKDNKLFLLAGDGKGHLSAPVSYYPGGGNPQGLTVADYNGDGAPDLAVTDWTTSSYMILYNTGGTLIKLTTSNANPKAGQSLTFTATVAASIAGSGTPGGTLAFKDGSKTLGTVNLNGGKASFRTAALSRGTHTIQASYYGSVTFNPHLSTGLSIAVQ